MKINARIVLFTLIIQQIGIIGKLGDFIME